MLSSSPVLSHRRALRAFVFPFPCPAPPRYAPLDLGCVLLVLVLFTGFLRRRLAAVSRTTGRRRRAAGSAVAGGYRAGEVCALEDGAAAGAFLACDCQ